MTITRGTSLRELAFLVGDALYGVGETAVLSGGGAAAIYSEGAYMSRDLDFVFAMHSVVGRVSSAPLVELGFVQRGGGYIHPDSDYTVEFPRGPLAIGEEIVTQWDTRTDDAGRILHILTPTDCVRDRLISFLHFNDYSALEQALAVARSQHVNLDGIQLWCAREGKPEKFDLFYHRLDSA